MATVKPGKDTIKRAAKLVRERREKLGLSQDLSEVGGPSRWVITELELKNRWPVRPATQMEIARALRWKEDAFDLLARGEDPVVDEGALSPQEMRSLIMAARSILEELERRLDQ